jgi:hypothetical protein
VSKKRYVWVLMLPGLLAIYAGSYLVLSLQGQYVPAGWGLAWVKDYHWAPRGFVSGSYGTDQNRTPQVIFMPLWVIDKRFLHTSEKAMSGRYPVNKRLDDQLQRGVEAPVEP